MQSIAAAHDVPVEPKSGALISNNQTLSRFPTPSGLSCAQAPAERLNSAKAHAWLGVRREILGLTALLLAAMVLHLLTLLRTPVPFVDEAWCASRAWALLRTGQAFGVLDAGVIDRFPGYWTYFPWLEAAFEALTIRVLGLSLFSMRLTHLAFGLLLLIAVYAIGRKLLGARPALLAVGLAALSRPFFLSGHLARPDIMAAALGFVGLALGLCEYRRTRRVLCNRGDGCKSRGICDLRGCHEQQRTGFPWRSALAGLAVTLACEMHPNAILYGPPILAWYLIEEGRTVWRSPRVWALASGAIGGLVFYAVLHIVRYPQTYWAISQINFGGYRTPPFLTLDPATWLLSLRELAAWFLWACDTRAVLAVVAVAGLWRKRSPAETKLIVLLLILLLECAALVSNKATYYAILIAPAADLVLVAWLTRLWRERRAASGRREIFMRLQLALIGALLLTSVILAFGPLRRDPMPDYQTTVDSLHRAVDPGATVMASQTYWFGMPGQRYLSWEQLVYYQRYAPGSTLADAFRALRPDVFVIDKHMAYSIVDDRARLGPYYEVFSLLRPELEAILAEHGELIATVETPTFGPVRIYRLTWD